MSPTKTCNACGKDLQTLSYMKCIKCKNMYDLECLTISTSSFENQTKQYKESWLCPQCVCSQPKQGNTSTPVHGRTMSGTCTSGNNVNLVRGTRGTAKPVEETSFTTENSELVIEIKKLREEIAVVRQQNSELGLLRKDVQALKTELSTLSSTINNKMKEFQKQLEDKDIEIAQLKTTISSLHASFNSQEQYSLRNELEIQGIPEEKAENLTHILLTVSQKLNVNLQETDINCINRTGSKQNQANTKPRPIVVQLVRKAKKDELLSAARIRKNLTTEAITSNSPASKIYLNERLTKANRLLFRETRARASLHGFRYCWLRNGSIFVRKADFDGAEKSPAILIRAMEDLDKKVGSAK